MIGLLEAAWVIARRDFVASVFSRSFIFFLVTPLLVLAASAGFGYLAARAESEASHPKVAVATDNATAQALQEARARLTSRMAERSFPLLERIEPAENVRVQARQLLADEEARLSAVVSGTLAAPVLSGPSRIDDFVTNRMALLFDEARQHQALQERAGAYTPVEFTRDVTSEAAGNLTELRLAVARFGQLAIFFFTLMLVGLLLSNMVEEKSNKVIEVLAAAVPLDAVFFGKLLAMLGISIAGIAAWVSVILLGTYLSVQLLPEGMLPSISPAVGWPAFVLLLLAYYTTNYMLLGSLFLAIGSQANSIREIQTLSMPVTFLQMGVLVLAMTAIGNADGWLAWAAYAFPFSSPLAMTAFAAQSDSLWPHLVALLWQAMWVFVTIRLAAGWFRRSVLKSGGKFTLLPKRRSRAPA
jgi:ABC-2 type transport system permease protein